MKDIAFTCYRYQNSTLFLFYINGIWDEDKKTLLEAVKDYPPEKFNWIHLDSDKPTLKHGRAK